MTVTTRTAIVLVIAFVLSMGIYACSKAMPKNDALFQKIETMFGGTTANIQLQTMTDFSWEDVCIFKSTKAYPSVGYNSYEDHLEKEGLDGKIPDNSYGLIFMFLDKGKIVKEFYQENNFFTIKGLEIPLELASRKSFVKFCATPDGLALSYDDENTPPALLISKQKPE